MATAPLLTLTTIVPQHSVLIDGISYFIRHSDALSLRQSQIANRAFARLGGLMQKDDLTEAEDAELSGLLQQVCGAVLEAPADVQTKLTDAQRLQIFVAFTPLRSSLAPPTIGAPAADQNPIGANGSHGSRTATAARRKSGSTKSR